MPTDKIRNGAYVGALSAFTSGRLQSDPTPGDYTGLVASANAFADAYLTANAALSVPMDDEDNPFIGELTLNVVFAILEGRTTAVSTASFFSTTATAAVAIAKQGEDSLLFP